MRGVRRKRGGAVTASGQQQGDGFAHHCDRCKDIERCKRAFGVYWAGKSYGGGCNTGFPELNLKPTVVEDKATEKKPESEPQKFSPPPGERKPTRPTASRPKFARKRKAIQEEMI